jgi:hypothetical protein
MDRKRYRGALLGLGAALAALVTVVWITNPSGHDTALPAPLESVYPLPGDAVLAQASIEVDLPTGYVVDLVVDGLPVSPAEIDSVYAVGTFRWEPGAGRVVETWRPGTHTVEVSWDRATGRPDPGSFSWSFRVT